MDAIQYQYQYRNFITEKYQYRIGIEYPYLHGISIVSVPKKVVSETSDLLLCGSFTPIYRSDFQSLIYNVV